MPSTIKSIKEDNKNNDCKKRKSASEILSAPFKNIPKSSKSLTEMGINSKTQNDINGTEKRKSESTETVKATGDEQQKSPKLQNNLDDDIKPGNPHSTPTSTFDDGYESCNSTPHGSGKLNSFIFSVQRNEENVY